MYQRICNTKVSIWLHSSVCPPHHGMGQGDVLPLCSVVWLKFCHVFSHWFSTSVSEFLSRCVSAVALEPPPPMLCCLPNLQLPRLHKGFCCIYAFLRHAALRKERLYVAFPNNTSCLCAPCARCHSSTRAYATTVRAGASTIMECGRLLKLVFGLPATHMQTMTSLMLSTP